MSINAQALYNWGLATTTANINSLDTQIQTFNNAWKTLANKITTQAYTPVAADLTNFLGTGSTSLSTLISNLQTTAGDLLQANANLAMDNCPIGGSRTTPFSAPPPSADVTALTNALQTTYGVGSPNNSSWTHYGTGWGDYFSTINTLTFESFGAGYSLSGGVGTAWGSGSVAGNAIAQGPASSGWPWTILPGAAQQLAVGSSSAIWCLSGQIDSGGEGFQIFKWNTSTNNWDLKPGALTQISVGSDGETWGINNVNNPGGGGRHVYRWTGTAWTEPYTSYGMEQIYVANASNIYAVDGLGYVYKWSGHDWTHLVGITSPSKVSVADDGTINAIYNQTIYQWTGSTWESFGGAQSTVLDDIFAVSSTVMYQYTSNGTNQYLYKHSGGTWTAIPLAPNAGNSSGAIQYVGKDGSLWSYISNPSATSPNFDNIYQYVGGVWTGIGDGWVIKVLVIAKDATRMVLMTSPVYMILDYIKNLGFHCGTIPCALLGIACGYTTVKALLELFDYGLASTAQAITIMGAARAAAAAATCLDLAVSSVLCSVIIAALMYFVCNCGNSTGWFGK